MPDTISILRGLKEKYEDHHGVHITDRCAAPRVASGLSCPFSQGVWGRHVNIILCWSPRAIVGAPSQRTQLRAAEM